MALQYIKEILIVMDGFLQFATYLLLLVAAFTQDGLSRHHQLNRHVSVEGTPGLTVLCEVTRDFHPSVLSLRHCVVFSQEH